MWNEHQLNEARWWMGPAQRRTADTCSDAMNGWWCGDPSSRTMTNKVGNPMLSAEFRRSRANSNGLAITAFSVQRFSPSSSWVGKIMTALGTRKTAKIAGHEEILYSR